MAHNSRTRRRAAAHCAASVTVPPGALPPAALPFLRCHPPPAATSPRCRLLLCRPSRCPLSQNHQLQRLDVATPPAALPPNQSRYLLPRSPPVLPCPAMSPAAVPTPTLPPGASPSGATSPATLPPSATLSGISCGSNCRACWNTSYSLHLWTPRCSRHGPTLTRHGA